MAREFVGEGLFEAIKEDLKPGEKVLIPCSSKSRTFLKDEIEALALEVDRVHTYNTVPGKVKNKRSFDEVDIVLFTSPSTVNNMVDMVGIEEVKKKKCIAIGPITFKALKERGIDGLMCKQHSEDGFLREIVEIVNKEV